MAGNWLRQARDGEGAGDRLRKSWTEQARKSRYQMQSLKVNIILDFGHCHSQIPIAFSNRDLEPNSELSKLTVVHQPHSGDDQFPRLFEAFAPGDVTCP